MKTTVQELSAKITAAVDFHAEPRAFKRGGGIETGNYDTLAKRLALPDRAHVSALIQAGRLKSFGPVHKADPLGAHRFSSALLDDIRREVLTEIAEQVIEEFDGEAKDLPGVVSVALADYMKSLKDGTAAKGFARKLPVRARSFAYPEEERPGLLRRAATGAAVAGGLYAGASYLRGRRTGARGLLPALKAGNAANVADLRKVGARIAGYIRPRVPVGFSASVTPARARALIREFGRSLRARNA